VTFTNSFAIEGHYFNFSTSGQWLWDELQVVVPPAATPTRSSTPSRSKWFEATAESARQAEQEWQRAVPAQRGKVFSGTPGVNAKPVVGGVEIAIRYITRANERFLLRAKLYQAAVDLLASKVPNPINPGEAKVTAIARRSRELYRRVDPKLRASIVQRYRQPARFYTAMQVDRLCRYGTSPKPMQSFAGSSRTAELLLPPQNGHGLSAMVGVSMRSSRLDCGT